MNRKLTASDLALWTALPMAQSSRIEGRLKMILNSTRSRALPRHFLGYALLVGVATLVPLALLHPAAQAQEVPPVTAAVSQSYRALAEPEDANDHVHRALLLKYYGAGWCRTHPKVMNQAGKIKPLRAAALYGSWAEAYGGIQSGKTEQYLLRAQALEPNNPQWSDRLGDLYNLKRNNASPGAARLQAQKALSQYELAIRLLGQGPGTSPAMAVAAFDAGEYDKARLYGNELLSRSEKFAAEDQTNSDPPSDELHHAHLVLGRLALREGDMAQAEAHLLAMGRVSGSPVLDTFGPNMQLAQDLLKQGDRPTVLLYFDECAKFWTFDHEKSLNTWKAQVSQGKTPDFGANLVY